MTRKNIQQTKEPKSQSLLLRLLLGIAIVAIICFVTWYVLDANKTANETLAPTGSSVSQPSPAASVTTKTYTDTAGVYSLQYPSNWKVVPFAGGGEGATPDWSKTSRMVTFIPPNAPNNNGVVVQADTDGTLKQQIAQSQAGTMQSQLRININGYSARPLETVYKGDAESYTDERYLIDHNGAEVFISFREKYHHDYPAADWDVSDQVPAFKKILNSITFLK